MKLSRITLFCTCVIFNSKFCLGQEITANNQKALQIQQNISKQFDLLNKDQEIKKKIMPSNLESSSAQKEQATKPGRCFNFKNLLIKNSELFPDYRKTEIFDFYKNKCINKHDIKTIIKTINKWYFDRGYITSRAYVPEQDINEGTLEIVILEGSVQAINLNSNTKRDQMQLYTAMPKSDLLNIRDIDQALYQINHGTTQNAKIKILPGNKAGTSIINITTKPVDTNKVYLGYDNFGGEQTGKQRKFISVIQDNMFGFNDYWSFYFNKNAESKNQAEHNQQSALSVSIPYGYWRFDFKTGQAKYKSLINGNNKDFTVSGSLKNFELAASRVIFRDDKQIIKLFSSLDKRNITSSLAGVLLPTGSYNLSTLEFGYNHYLQLQDLITEVSVSKVTGLKSFGATIDEKNLYEPEAQFSKYVINGNIYTPILDSLSLTSFLQGQYTENLLYTNERISMGDYGSVRGYEDSPISGDIGGFIRNELSYKISPFTDINLLQQTFGDIKPYIGFDFGYTSSTLGKGRNSFYEGALKSAAIGIKNQNGRVNFNLSYAKPIKHPSQLDDDNVVYLNVNVKAF